MQQEVVYLTDGLVVTYMAKKSDHYGCPHPGVQKLFLCISFKYNSTKTNNPEHWPPGCLTFNFLLLDLHRCFLLRLRYLGHDVVHIQL